MGVVESESRRSRSCEGQRRARSPRNPWRRPSSRLGVTRLVNRAASTGIFEATPAQSRASSSALLLRARRRSSAHSMESDQRSESLRASDRTRPQPTCRMGSMRSRRHSKRCSPRDRSYASVTSAISTATTCSTFDHSSLPQRRSWTTTSRRPAWTRRWDRSEATPRFCAPSMPRGQSSSSPAIWSPSSRSSGRSPTPIWRG